VKKLTILSLIALAGAGSIASSAQAQFSYNPFQIGASAGVAIPTGDLGTGTNMGYNVTLSVGYKPRFTPIGVRAEAAYNQFGLEGGGGNVNIPAFTGNLVYGLPMVSFSPYIIGGAGLYRPNLDLSGAGTTDAENRFGFNVGGGVRIPFSTSFETFIEARYNRVTVDNGNLSFVPITVGVMF